MNDAGGREERAARRAAWRAEVAAVGRLAGPVVVVQVGMMVMGTIDTMMLGRVSEDALAAGAQGHNLAFGLLVFPMGLLMAVDPLIAQAFGAGDRVAVSRHLQRGLALAALLAVPVSILMWDARPLLAWLEQPAAVVSGAGAYLEALIPGNIAFLLFVALRQSLQAMSVVRPAVVAIVVANAVNVVANYALIFGNLGFPALGVAGSGWATSISRWTMLAVLIAAAWPLLRPHLSDLRGAVVRLPGYWRMLRIGTPIGFQTSLEMWLFTAVALIMGRLGSRELAAHQIALNLAALAFMVPLGIAGAATTRVGNAIGRGSMPGARRAAAVSLALGGGVMTVSAAAFWLAPDFLARLYTDELPVVAVAATLIPIAALFQIVDGLQVVGAGVLRGAADTTFPAAIAFVGYWLLGLPAALFLAFPAAHGPRGLWWGLTLGLSSVAVLLLARIRVRFAGTIVAVEAHDVRPSSSS